MSTDPVLRIGVLGAARITPFALVQPARTNARVKVVAVSARDPERARAFATKHGIEKVHVTYPDLLDDPDIDAIYNPLPNSHHSRWAIEALQKGKHVLCEKPLAANASDASAMSSARKQSGKVLMEALHWRYTPLARRLIELLERKAFGDVQRIEAAMCIPLPLPNDIRFRLDLAGGALMDTGVYAASMLRTAAHAAGLGEPVVTSAAVKLMRADVDRFARAEVAFETGAVGVLKTSLWSMSLLDISLKVTGSKGALSIFNPVAPQFPHRFRVTVDGKTTREHFKGSSSYGAQLEAFASACLDGAPVITTAEDAVRNAQLIDAIYLKAGLPVRQPIKR